MSQHAKYTCTFCGKVNVKRQATGIWECKSCKKVRIRPAIQSRLLRGLMLMMSQTMAGGAYVVSTPAAAATRSTMRRLRELAET